MTIKAKRVKLKKEIWPYPVGTILVSYCGHTPFLYYVEDNKMPTGKGLNIQWFTEKGIEYYEEYFEQLDPIDFIDTIWAARLAENLKNQKHNVDAQIEQCEMNYKEQMKTLKTALHDLEQEWVNHFGTDINAEIIEVEPEPPPPQYISYGYGTGSTGTGYGF